MITIKLKNPIKMNKQSRKARISILFFMFLMVSLLKVGYTQNEIDWRKIEGRDFGSKKWYEIVDDPNVTFQEVQKAFYKEWEGKEYESGKGYKQFKRMELFMQGQEDQFIERKLRNSSDKNQSTPRSSNTANWTAVGPLSPPEPRTGSGLGIWNNDGIGRIDVIAFDPVDSDILYVGSPNGGLWKSVNNGVSWTSISDNSWPNHAVSDIAIDPNNTQIIYVATGTREGGNGLRAEGIMKSINGGATWTHFSTNINSNTYYRLLIDPNASNKLLLATRDGIYYSTNSGSTWTASSFPAAFTNSRIYDIEYQPNNPSIVYAGGDGVLFISNNGGISFTEMQGVPFSSSVANRIAVAVTPADPNSAFFHVSDDDFLGIYKYNGGSFTTIADGTESVTFVDGSAYSSNLGDAWWAQVFYDWSFSINPNNANDMIACSTLAFRSKDGGNTWQAISSSRNGGGNIHVDMHAAEFHPITNVPYIGCDGGTYQWASDGAIWNRLNDMNISEMYTLDVSETNPSSMICGLQDNGAFYYASGTWRGITIGDVVSVAIDPVNPDIIYNTTTSNPIFIQKSTDKGVNWTRLISDDEINESTGSTFGQPEIKFHPFLRHVLFTGFDNIYKSVDGGQNWVNISNGAVGTRFKSHLEVAPSNPNYIYTATFFSGGIYRTSNGGATWINIPSPSSTSNLFDITIDDKNPNHIYAAMSNGKVFESVNGGSTWVDISAGLSNNSTRAIEYLPGSTNELYLATTKGIYYKNGTNDWQTFNSNLPIVQCRDIELTPIDGKIKVATFGRGVWESPLENPSNKCYASTPVITSSGLGCSSEGITLTTNSPAPSGYNYQWYRNDQLLVGATSSVYTTTTNGTYSVRLLGACHGFSSNHIKIELSTSLDISASTEGFESGVVFKNLADDNLEWNWHTGPTDSNETGPSSASEGAYYLYVEASGNNNPSKVAILETACFEVTTQTTLEFDYHLYGATLGSLEVQITADDGMTWTNIFSESGNKGNQWNIASINLFSYVGEKIVLRFIGTTGSNWSSDIAIDHIRFKDACSSDDPVTCMDTGSDFEALMTLYNETNGNEWINNSNWGTQDVCTWYGVTCENGRVTELNLSNNNLNGCLPAQLCNLTFLESLELDRNQLIGHIPQELGNLTFLKRLDLSRNQLIGHIPRELGNLIDLERLFLGHNHLVGSIPSELGNLTKLTTLLLWNNKLEGNIPPAFGNLPALIFLILENNNLEGTIPPELGNLNNLEWLYLGNNNLEGSIPPELGYLANLIQLELQTNRLEGCIPPSLNLLCENLGFYDNGDPWINISNNPSLDAQDFVAFCDSDEGACSECPNEISITTHSSSETNTVHAQNIYSSSAISAGSNITYRASNAVNLQINFQVQSGAEFLATIEDCPSSTSTIVEPTLEQLKTIARVKNEHLTIYPNPLTDETTIEYNLEKKEPVLLQVLDLLGRRVRILANGQIQQAGAHRITFDRRQLQGGTYIVVLRQGDTIESKKMVLLD